MVNAQDPGNHITSPQHVTHVDESVAHLEIFQPVHEQNGEIDP